MNRLRFIFSFLIIFMLSPMHRIVAQGTETLSDSLVYGIAMYKDLYKEYTNKKALLQQQVIETVKETFPDASKMSVNLNTKLATVADDQFAIFDLVDVLKEKFGVAVTEEDVVNFAIVNDIFNAVRPAGDSIMLTMAYYPWRMVFDSRSVHRVGVYEDGINILTDLTEMITDTIQRGIYLDELMNIYDVWYEYIDTINKRMDVDFSRALIKSNKARKYDELLPALYGLKWDVGKDTLNSKEIQDHVFTPEVSRLYNYMQDALYEPDGKDDLYYEVPYKFFRLSHSRLSHLNKLGRYQTYAEQYAKDFDSVNVRFEYYKSLTLRKNVEGNISYRHNEVADMYDAASSAMIIGSSKNWREKEVEFRKQLYEKMDLWDFGLEAPDPKFLNRIINGINTDSSDVYIEAMELYVGLPPTSADMLAGIMKYRRRLAKTYGNRQEYDKAVKLYQQIATDEKDPLKKSEAYYNAAITSHYMKKYNDVIVNCRRAIKSNSNYGDAYFLLGQAYANSHWRKNWKSSDYEKIVDKLIHLLAIDKYELALKKAREYAADPILAKYNSRMIKDESNILKLIESTKYNDVPTQKEVFDWGVRIKNGDILAERSQDGKMLEEGDVLNILGEKVRVCFYQ